MPIEDRLFDRGLSEVRNGDQKVQKYVFCEIFYGRQEVPKHVSYPEIFSFSVNINGRFTYTGTLFIVCFKCHVP